MKIKTAYSALSALTLFFDLLILSERKLKPCDGTDILSEIDDSFKAVLKLIEL